MKTFSRSHRNKVFAGVCGGLGEYTNIDPLLIRLAFIITAFMGGAGLGIYILLWICTPFQSDYETDDPIEDTPYTDVSDQAEEAGGTPTSSGQAEDYKHENHQGRTDYERYENHNGGSTEKTYRKKADTKNTCSAKPEKTSGHWATFFGIILFLSGLFWLGEIFNLFHFRFRALLNLWPLILCFAGLNLIPMKRPVRITLNTILIIGIVLLILYVGFCPEACGNFNTWHFSRFWY